MSCWLLMTKSKPQLLTFSWVFSHSQRDADFSKMTSSPNHRQLVLSDDQWVADFSKLSSTPNHGQTDFKPVGDFRFLSSSWNALVLGLCLIWMTHVLGKLLLVLDAEFTVGKHVRNVWVSQQSKRTWLAKQCFQGPRGVLLKPTVSIRPDASCFCEQIVSWMLLQASSYLIW